MRLLSKTILYFTLVSIPVILVCGVVAYKLINEAVEENVRENLWNEKVSAEKLIDNDSITSDRVLSFDSLTVIKIENTNASGYKFLRSYKIDAEEGEQIGYLVLRSYHKKGNTNYMIKVMRPELEQDDLIENLIMVLLLVIGLLILSFAILSYFLSKRLWLPFNKTLVALSNFKIGSGSEFIAEKTSTREFTELNKVLEEMITKVNKDFLAQKEFTENASHELQTPLAIIKNKTELLLQESSLSDKQKKELFEINQTIGKLSKLNQTLLLFAKLENQQFVTSEKIDLFKIVNSKLEQFEDLINMKHFEIEKNIKLGSLATIHPELADIVISNLLINAIKYTKESGQIKIELNDEYFCISNSGSAFDIDGNKLFERFFKLEQGQGSTGLGLALVKQIALLNDHMVEYGFNQNMHIFKYIF